MKLKKRIFATAGLAFLAAPALFTPNSVFALEASGVDASVVDATATPKVEKPGFSDPKLAEQMNKQILWLDFGDHAAWSNVDYIKYRENGDFNKWIDSDKSYTVVTKETPGAMLALKEGSVYRKEISDGYIVQLTVKSLKPFRASDVYRKRLEAGGATEKELATYDASATNKFKGTFGKLTSPELDKEARVIAREMDTYAQISHEGINTGTRRTTLASTHDGADWGVQFEVKVIRNGVETNATVVMADGEEANPGEISIFTTNGTGWEHIGEWERDNAEGHAETYKPNLVGDYLAELLQDRTDHSNYGFWGYTTRDGFKTYWSFWGLTEGRENEDRHYKDPYAWRFVQNPDKATSGLGTGVFGPNISANTKGVHAPSVPIVKTDNASEVGIYVTSMGRQNAMIGFILNDLGDAPESYGQVSHAISMKHGGSGTDVKQPYLGSARPDADTKPDASKPWTADDADASADEGATQLTGEEKVIAKRTDTGFKVTVKANRGGLDKAYVKGWIDFNNNGTFDEGEASEMTEVTADGNVELTFTTDVKAITTAEVGSRIRIAENAEEIQQPTGFAGSGEVEDQLVNLEIRTFYIDKEGNEIATKEDGLKDKKSIDGYRYIETRTRENGDREHVYEQLKTTFVDVDGNTLLPTEKGLVEKKAIDGYEFVRTDTKENGDIEHVYKQVIPAPEDPEKHKNITTFVDTEGNVVSPKEDGLVDKKEIDGYEFVKTIEKENGDREHVYTRKPDPIKPVTTFVDKNGKPLKPAEDGEQPKKDIPGYRFIETRKKPNGDVEHVYEKFITTFVDEEGKTLRPQEDGLQEKKSIDGYEFVKTVNKENGDREHVYKRVPDPQKPVTSFIDKSGKSLIPNEDGEQPKKDIDGYRFIETRKKPNGDIEHVYERFITTFVDEDGKTLRPKEDGLVDKKEIEGYTFVRTNKKDNGDIEHVYKRIPNPQKPVTSFIDKDGKSIIPNEDGEQPKKDIDGYKFIETRKKDNGDIEHVYEKIQPVQPAQPEKKLPNTGVESVGAFAALGTLFSGLGFGILKGKKKK